MGRRILVTGSGRWTDETVIHQTLHDELAKTPTSQFLVVVHSGAKGAESIAMAWAYDQLRRGKKVRYEAFVANPATMIESGAEVCHAFPVGESVRTRQVMDLAQQAGVPVIDHGLTAAAGQKQ